MFELLWFSNICRRFDIEGYEHEDNMTFLRRSTRQRKFLYGTFNQRLMLDAPSLDSVEHEKTGDEGKETLDQSQAVQQQSDDQPASDTEVTHNVCLLASVR